MMELDQVARLVQQTAAHATQCRADISLASTRQEHIRATALAANAGLIASNMATLQRLLTNGEIE